MTYDANSASAYSLRGGAAAAPFYVRGEDDLRLLIRTAIACTVTVEGRFLDTDGCVLPFVEPFVSTSVTRAVQTFPWRLGEGWVLSLAVRVTSGTPQVGQVYAQVRVQRGQGTGAINMGTLVQGYVTESDDLSWPGSVVMPSVAGPGAIIRFPISNPGVGTDFSIAPPARIRWRLLAVNFTLAAVGAANREACLSISDGVGTVAFIPSGVTQIAAETRIYSFFQAAPRGAGTQSPNVIAPLPFLLLNSSWAINSSVVGIQAGDQLSNISATVEEWIED